MTYKDYDGKHCPFCGTTIDLNMGVKDICPFCGRRFTLEDEYAREDKVSK